VLGITWRRSARAALNEILAYIAEHDPAAARQLRGRVLHSVELARSHPELFRKGRLPDTREIVAHPNYIVVYRVRPGRIQVLSVVHARREYPPAQ
jgi:toxin ParE1/3/4